MDPSPLHLEDFRYELPERLIAQTPLSDRGGSRLLVRKADGTLQHSMFRHLPEQLPAGTLLLYNDSRVLPGRLLGHTPHGGKLELMLLRPLSGPGHRWEALGRPLRKLHEGLSIQLASGCVATIERRHQDAAQPYLEVSFNLEHEAFFDWMEKEGYIPLPPYIARPDAISAPESPDRDRYQTIYANERGSVAAPTAGLHFDAGMWDALREAGIQTAPVTLHVGGGTFLPVKTNDLDAHVMHRETYRLSRQTFAAMEKALAEKRPIVAVGTTTLRCLESFAQRMRVEGADSLVDQWQDTQLFLYPRHREDRYRPWAVSGLMTNFHQPESSLLMLVSALLGYENMQKVYREAVAQEYRFLSYGDTSLLWLPD
ncbi:MAG TPA: tRNA preQ1(34) S-adenosylmethionine ribosyltransferase-isomerase QueA [Oligoflexus sp.]|uniref:tRNA preQ1(34) S-adenosylmethionine ribosyltransferase-isomerase QueA n=1 Tax=Oligoflexus sp. TaxID=1971216 RepID=UPI002D4648B4|nr:tRNA preQ1(34) S-adenosylmethionine ribosyltransferase-isomerase QueA [Oligoflexus sp.]HYX36806.1 tRNA preQ1(34) S-adenosylmethionine ribosyltransferase-isomerase QueA [Oligoflexus sp.]